MRISNTFLSTDVRLKRFGDTQASSVNAYGYETDLGRGIDGPVRNRVSNTVEDGRIGTVKTVRLQDHLR